ncbi:MAG: hypothetical protein IMZ50_01250 [Candidatus Atribacteria bacterium]|nr:hypothetical protein [Candidatus Atribacteria bacterium]
MSFIHNADADRAWMLAELDGLSRRNADFSRIPCFLGAEPISNEKLLERDAAVLFPSVREGVILEKDDVFVLPDFLANAGGVMESCFEQVQNACNFW